VRIAIVDSGWDRASACTPSVEPGVSFVDGSNTPTGDDTDTNGHGTGCIWLAARMAPAALFTPVRVFGATIVTSVAALIRAFEWTVEHQFDVVSLSLGTGEPDAAAALYVLCERARALNTLVVASMDRMLVRQYPAAFDNVLSVESGSYESPFDFSYDGSALTECHIGARYVRTTGLDGTSTLTSGSSLAAPQMAGLIALFREARPTVTLGDIRRLLAAHSIAVKAHADPE
jgi:subtilisin family serine protease